MKNGRLLKENWKLYLDIFYISKGFISEDSIPGQVIA